MTLGEQLQAAKQRDQIKAWDEGERRVAAELKLTIPATTLTTDIQQSFGVFAKWCEFKSVRRCPARPKSIAAFLLDQAALGATAQVLLSMVQAIDALHQYHGLSSPIHTAAVHAALERVIQTEAPRSWSKSEKAEWALLPAPIRAALTRRETERDQEIRRLHSKVAKEMAAIRLRHEEELLRQTDGAATKPVHIEEDQTHAQA